MRIEKLDGLRGIFSLMIVIYHYPAECLPDFLSENFIIKGSYIFVDFFFVLSGFVISYNYNALSTVNQFISYIKKRFVRIYPLLLFSLLVMSLKEIITNIYFVEYLINQETPETFLNKFLETSLLMNSTPILGTTRGFNSQSWSISSEMISYIYFGVITVLFNKKFRLILFSISILASSIALYYLGSYFAVSDYGFLRGLICFNAGYLVWYFSKRKFSINNNLELIITISLIAVLYQLNKLEHLEQDLLNFSIVAIPLSFSLFLFILIKSNGLLSKLLKIRPIQYLGKLSYSIYLNHGIFFLIPIWTFRWLNIEHSVLNQLLMLVIVISSIIIYSKYTYAFIELGGGKFLKSILFKKIEFSKKSISSLG